MNLNSIDLPTSLDILALIALIGAAYLVVKSSAVKQTVSNQKELIDTLEKRITALEEQHKEDLEKHLENARAIGALQAKLDEARDIPLKKIAKAIEKTEIENTQKFEVLQKILTTQNEIIKRLNKE